MQYGRKKGKLYIKKIVGLYCEIPWNDYEKTVTIQEIRDMNWDIIPSNESQCIDSYKWTNEQHLGRIKYLMQNKWNEPIEIVAMGSVFDIVDGNHRFLAAIALGLTQIDCSFFGEFHIFQYLNKSKTILDDTAMHKIQDSNIQRKSFFNTNR